MLANCRESIVLHSWSLGFIIILALNTSCINIYNAIFTQITITVLFKLLDAPDRVALLLFWYFCIKIWADTLTPKLRLTNSLLISFILKYVESLSASHAYIVDVYTSHVHKI